MSFELEIPTEAKLTEYGVLSEKDREPDTNPGAAMSFTMTVPNEVLSMFDPFLRGMIFCKNANSSGEQASIVADLPNLTAIGKALGEFSWDQELTGYTLTFDYGLAGKSNFSLGDCTLLAWRFHGKEGGSTVVKVKVEAPDASEKIHGKLAFLKGQTVKVLLIAPAVDAATLPDLEAGMPSGKKRDAKQTPAQGLGAALGQTAADPAAKGEVIWPFPNSGGKKAEARQPQ